jgi:copper resistance protein B
VAAVAQDKSSTTGGAPTTDNQIHSFFLMDQLESRFTRTGPDSVQFNGFGWVGGDYNRIWIKPEGTKVYDGPWEDVDVQLLYGRLIAPFWDLQAGVRYFQASSAGPARASAVFGVQGLAPQWFDVEAAAFISNRGEVSARLELEYEFLLTQRLVLQPRLETNIAVQQVKELGIGQGVNDLEVGVRLRYEIWREFAPYIGIAWTSKFGETADFSRARGNTVRQLNFVVGVRFWF